MFLSKRSLKRASLQVPAQLPPIQPHLSVSQGAKLVSSPSWSSNSEKFVYKKPFQYLCCIGTLILALLLKRLLCSPNRIRRSWTYSSGFLQLFMFLRNLVIWSPSKLQKAGWEWNLNDWPHQISLAQFDFDRGLVLMPDIYYRPLISSSVVY